MSSLSVFERFRRLNTWRREGEQAPHKPLLVLYALGRWHTARQGRIPYADIDRDLTALLKEFGPDRQSYHPEYPFWRLQNDGVWEVHAPPGLEPRAGNTDPKRSELLAHPVTAGFPDGILAVFYADPAIVFDLAQAVLDAHFPPEVHPAILQRVGLARQSFDFG
jgi:putative restriction endonuclease